MWIRRPNGSVFHCVSGISADKLFYLCLCGQAVVRNFEQQQLVADGMYIRCPECRQIEFRRFRREGVRYLGVNPAAGAQAVKPRKNRSG
jgi:DNA-directed RNA polymerase subunit RPC12/RpoP